MAERAEPISDSSLGVNDGNEFSLHFFKNLLRRV
jgi:hypothetical protein